MTIKMTNCATTLIDKMPGCLKGWKYGDPGEGSDRYSRAGPKMNACAAEKTMIHLWAEKAEPPT